MTLQLPPGPKYASFIQLLKWVFKPMPYMEECVAQYGDIFTLRFTKDIPYIIFVSNPQTLQKILTQDTRGDFTAPGNLNGIFRYILGNNSLIMLSGEAHQRQRQLMMPSFHGERMRTYTNVINEVTTECIKNLKVGQPFDARSLTQSITLQVIMQAVFGLHTGERAEKLAVLLANLLEQTSSPARVLALYIPILQNELGGITPWAAQLRLQRTVDELIYAEISDRRTNLSSSRTDILSLLMSATDEQGKYMTDEELRDELMTLLVAGHETTATALAWALYWIHKLPEVKEKLLLEINSLGENPDANAIFKLPYLDAICNETLRIYPVGMLTFPRQTTKEISLDGYTLPEGSVVMGSIYLTHHRSDLYPESKVFNPDRFLNKQFTPFEFLPFGGGARRCIGSAFAMFEMKLSLVKILTNWDLALLSDRDIGAKRRGLVTAPEKAIEMVLK